MSERRHFAYKMLTILIVFAVFFSSTGISLHKHVCACHNEVIWTFFPEIQGVEKSCCCEIATEAQQDDVAGALQLNDPNCCKDVKLFYKVPSIYISFFSAIERASLMVTDFPLVYNYLLKITIRDTDPEVSLYRPPPLQLIGISFIRFTHNLKIPLPANS